MTKTLPPKKAAELSALLVQETAAFDTARDEHERLAAQDPAVACDGIDALRRHRGLMLDAELRRDVAKANAERLRGQLAATQEREAEEARRVRYDTHVKDREARQQKYSTTLHALYDAMIAALENGMAEQTETDAINKDLPKGAVPIAHFESEMRHKPAVPSRQEIVEVKRPKKKDGDVRPTPKYNALGELADVPIPTEIVKETRIIAGERERRLRPLWDAIELPPLDFSFSKVRALGTRPPSSTSYYE